MANPDLQPGALQKPEKGSCWKQGRDRRKKVKATEDAEKDKVRARDKFCRWPHCENCRVYKPRLEVAHVVAKGMGGDHGTKSTADQMILVDWLTHQSGNDSLEQHGREYLVAIEASVGGPYVRD